MLLADRLTDAQKVFEAHLELFPEDAEAYDNLGEIHHKAGRKDAAIASYKKSLALDPANTNAVKMLEKLGVKP
jgi:predicted TPR repeat methyltransferase